MPKTFGRLFGVIEKITRRRTVFAAIKNISWLSLDNFINVSVSALVAIVIARAIGAEAMGIWSFVIAIYSLSVMIVALGMDQILIVDLVDPKTNHRSILATALATRITASLIAGAALVGLTFLIHADNPYQTPLLFLMLGVLIIMSFDICGNWFRSQLMFKFVVIPNIIANVLGGIIKVLLAFYYHSLLLIGYASVVQAILTEAILMYFLWRHGIRFNIVKDFSLSLFKPLLHASTPLMLSSIAVFVYTRGSLFFLDAYRTKEEIGFYSAASRVSEVLYVFPMILVPVLAPTMYARWREDRALFERNFRTILNGVTFLIYVVAFLVMCTSRAIVTLLFGAAFAPAAVVLTLHVWTLIAVAQGTITSIWLMAEKRSGLLMIRTIIGGFASILLNMILIPPYGIVGAAISALVSMFIAGVLVHAAFGPEFRQMLTWQIRSLLLLDVLPSIRELFRSWSDRKPSDSSSS